MMIQISLYYYSVGSPKSYDWVNHAFTLLFVILYFDLPIAVQIASAFHAEGKFLCKFSLRMAYLWEEYRRRR